MTGGTRGTPRRAPPQRGSRLARALLALLAVGLARPAPAFADEGEAPAPALFRLEPLGLDAERTLGLETLLRIELEALAGRPLPSRRQIERALDADTRLRGCTGDPACLAALGRRLGVAQVISGSVAALGDSYLLDLKLVDVDGARELRRVSQPLQGRADELIRAVRVTAWLLVVPDRVRGSVAVLADVPGATVLVDRVARGTTPLPGPVGDLSTGWHVVRVEAAGYAPFVTQVEVELQKVTQVVARLVVDPSAKDAPPRRRASPWYANPLTLTVLSAAAITAGILVGNAVGGSSTVSCRRQPESCAP